MGVLAVKCRISSITSFFRSNMESPIVKQRIILDTDPGIDDALALFLALASPEVQLEAVTTVSGNVPIEHTTRNALTLLELAVDVHGENGLGNVILPEPQRQPVGQHAIELLIERIMAAPGEIALVCVGPLTNVAQAVRREPRLAQTVRELVIMGGALRVPGNITPCAEFNIFADPHAAHIVLHAGWPVRLVALDVTTRTLFKRELAEQLAASGSPVTVLIKRMMDYYCDIFGQARRLDAIQMHDPLCLAAAFRPDLLTWEEAYVDVELAGSLTLGETVGFFAGSGKLLPHSPNVLASVDVDRESFIDLYVERIRATFA